MMLSGGPLDGEHKELSGLARVTEFAVMCRCGGACFDAAQYDRDGRWVRTVCRHTNHGGEQVGRAREYVPPWDG